MTQPEEAVGGEPIVDSQLTPEERLNAAFADPANHQEDEPAEDDGEQPEIEAAEDDIDLEAEDEELPPIDAPVSWDAEAKERFSKLPREDQEYLVKRESERERFVQSKAQEAAQARRDAEQTAIQQLAHIERSYAEHVQQYVDALQPVEPDVRLLISEDPRDRALYAQQDRGYKATIAQRAQAQQTAEQLSRQAQEREEAVERQHHAEQHQLLSTNFPEYLDPTTGPELQRNLSSVARELGYPPELIAEARATDIIAMKTAAEWRSDALKYRSLMSKKMEKVRQAKSLPKMSKPGSPQAPGATRDRQYATDREAMRGGDKNATQRVLDSFFTSPK